MNESRGIGLKRRFGDVDLFESFDIELLSFLLFGDIVVAHIILSLFSELAEI
jgi:hypothetical protein